MLRHIKRFGILAVSALAAGIAHAAVPSPRGLPPSPTPKPAPTATPLPPPLAGGGGDIPQSVVGTWLSVERMQIPVAAQKGTPAPPIVGSSLAVLRIGYDGQHWRVEQLRTKMPPVIAHALTEANTRGVPFVPTAEQLHAVVGATAKASVIKVGGHIVLFTPGHAPGTNRNVQAPDVKLTLGFLGGGGHVATGGTTYEFTSIAPDQLSGRISHGMVSFTNERMVFPLGVRGDVTVYRVPAKK